MYLPTPLVIFIIVFLFIGILLYLQGYNRIKYKTIISQGKTFLLRLSLYHKSGSSLKLHLILDDDKDEPHDHPWDFSSIILFGGYYENKTKYGIGDINVKLHSQKHKIKLRRVLGIKIPTLTFGIYSEKKQLCSLCREIGYCKSNQ